ncbi:MAG TPA: CHASE3 domain-containing protein, partial [Candidatus Limnocylindrales bacterium]|nr:CHASE3 domain-containing protein [Candidatus Limnocylindrales bacterium]
MDQRSFQKLLRRTVLLPVALLLLLAATLVVEILLLNASIRWVDHTDQVIANARQLIRYMVDMESGIRGYFLTGDTFFLDSYIAAKPQVPEQLALLEQLTSDNPDQAQRIGEIRDLDLRWIRYADNLLLHPNPRTLSSQDYAAGKELMDRIRAKQREILDAEDRLYHARYRRAAVLGNIVIGTAVGLSLLTAVLLFTLTRRELFELSSAYDKHLKAEAEKTQQLQESRESYRITLRSLGDAVVATDAAGNVSFLNPVAEQLTGWDYQAARGRPLHEVLRILDERTRTELEDAVALVRRSQPVVNVSSHVALISRSGQEYPLELTGSPILNDRNQLVGVVAVFRDITQRRQTEQTLRSSERLALAGRLSATIAHEIRNPLDTVSNLIYLLRHEEDPSNVSSQYLELASDELARIAQITGQLLTFHREAQAPVEVNLADVLQSVLVLFAPQIRKGHVDVEQRFEAVPLVRGFPGELRQVFSNLVGNALDAMPNGGKLILHLRESSLASDVTRLGVRITILDTGAGIPPGVRKNLFAPFFTTKGEKGTGLGLWVSRGLIEK